VAHLYLHHRLDSFKRCTTLRPTRLFPAYLALGGLLSSVTPCNAADVGSPQAEPTKEACLAAVGEARTLAVALPEGDASRYFAERDLEQALTEAGNGEFDDCLEWAERATVEVREHRHTLQPGEKLKVREANE
jgi:hypothetical protein